MVMSALSMLLKVAATAAVIAGSLCVALPLLVSLTVAIGESLSAIWTIVRVAALFSLVIGVLMFIGTLILIGFAMIFLPS